MLCPVLAPALPLESLTSNPVASVSPSPQALGFFTCLAPLLEFLPAPQMPLGRLIPLPALPPPKHFSLISLGLFETLSFKNTTPFVYNTLTAKYTNS